MGSHLREQAPSEAETWTRRRTVGPQELLESDALTDVTLAAGDNREFRAHKVILAAHSDYFHRLLVSGMREPDEGRVVFPQMEAHVLEAILRYVYTGTLLTTNATASDDDIEALGEIYEAANMLQMQDLESAVQDKLADCCTADNCLEMYILSKRFDGQHPGKEKVAVILEETVRDHWSSLANSASFAALHPDDLCSLLDMKAAKEEIADLSFSFCQSDLCEGVLTWTESDVEARQSVLCARLCRYFCLHQLNSGLKKRASNLMAMEKCDQIDQLCQGNLCPRRKVEGLIVIHGWTPHARNTITADHVAYNFIIPSTFGSRPSSSDFETVMKSNVLYSLKEFGELGEAEKHLLIPNNIARIEPIDAHMLLTVDNGLVSGMIVDGVKKQVHCAHHHSIIYHFCPSTVPECKCDQSHLCICYDMQGYVYAIMTCEAGLKCDISYDPCCDTFKRLRSPVPLCGAMAVISEDTLLLFGGYYSAAADTTAAAVEANYSYIVCSGDLIEYPAKSMYRSGHAVVTSETTSLKQIHRSNGTIRRYCLAKEEWIDAKEDQLPFDVCDAATVVTRQHLYVIGGYTVQYSQEFQFYYQMPTTAVWIMNLATGQWTEGPPLPPCSDGRLGYMRGTAHVVREGILFSGGATLVYPNRGSNKICDYKTNTKVYYLPLSLEDKNSQWQTVQDLSHCESMVDDYVVYAAIPSKICLPSLKVVRGSFVQQVFARGRP